MVCNTCIHKCRNWNTVLCRIRSVVNILLYKYTKPQREKSGRYQNGCKCWILQLTVKVLSCCSWHKKGKYHKHIKVSEIHHPIEIIFFFFFESPSIRYWLNSSLHHSSLPLVNCSSFFYLQKVTYTWCKKESFHEDSRCAARQARLILFGFHCRLRFTFRRYQ